MTMRNFVMVLTGTFLIVLNACAPSRRAMPPMLAEIDGVSEKFHPGQIIDLKAGKALSFDGLMDQLKSVELVFVGENHDNPEHHLIQVQALQGLMARYNVLTVAMEFFPRPSQGIVDKYMEGGIDEPGFLKEIEWKKTWGFPYHFYRPLIVQVREKNGALLAINAPREVVRKVARSGLAGLSDEERSQVARDLDLDNKEHKTYMKKIFGGHSHHGLKHFDSFYEAQCVWDETMAETIADYLENNPGPMVVFTGNGHIVNKFGIPDRVKRRMAIPMATIAVYPLREQLHIDREMADYLWLTGYCSSRKHPFSRKSRPR